MDGVDIRNIPMVESYLSLMKDISQDLCFVMNDLKSSINRVSNIWKDDSIERAKGDVETSIKNIEYALRELEPLLNDLKKQIEWARDFNNIR